MSEDIRREPSAQSADRPDRVREDDTVHPHGDVPVDDVPVDPTSQPAATDEPARDTTHRGDIDRDPSSERVEPTGASGPGASTAWSADTGLLPDEDFGTYRQRWDELQVRFIDEPRQSVREADDLVGEVTRKISERFTHARDDFEQRWEGDNEPTTEELRLALQRYRDFFRRLVTQ